MMQQPKRHVSFLINTVSVLVISLLSTLAPAYAFLLFLIFYMVFFYIVYRITMRTSKMPPLSELGAPLHREVDSLKIAVTDPGLNKDLSSQFKFLMVTLAISLLAVFLYPLYNGLAGVYVISYLNNATGNILLSRFINYMTMYTLILVVLYSVRWAVTKKVSSVNLIIPQSFAIYRKGIVINNRNFIQASPTLCFTVNKQRRFIEIQDKTSGGSRIRLYTKEPATVYEKLVEVGFNECKT
jgi:uncharacterized membrane protein